MSENNERGLSPEPQKGFKERMYDKVKLPVWALDIIIAVLVIALVVSIYLGTR
jgi:hypothetical protein